MITTSIKTAINIHHLGMLDYSQTWEMMKTVNALQTGKTNTIHLPKAYTKLATKDEQIWICEHPPIYTLGRQARREHLLNANSIPLVETDRGGHITYHGPGQLVIYPLINLRSRKMGVKAYVCLLEKTLCTILNDNSINAHLRDGMPGIYVDNRKIASIGIRVRQGWTYHGIALNIDMDLSPFQFIHPCGYANLQMTQVRDFSPITATAIENQFLHTLLPALHPSK